MDFTSAYPVIEYSRFQPKFLAGLVQAEFELTPSLSCMFYVQGMHDNYLIQDNSNQYILRLYRSSWRSEQAILFELTFLQYLARTQCAVIAPLTTNQGSNHIAIDAPEGKRYAALFPFAKGISPGRRLNSEQCFQLGKQIAKIHITATKFASNYVRQELNLSYLLDDSLNAIKHYISEYYAKEFHQLSTLIHQKLSGLPKRAPFYTICTGDVNSSNFFIDNRINIAIIDFDQCGYGWRAFEIGKFKASIISYDDSDWLFEAFVKGYEQVSILDESELNSMPYFTLLALIWVAALHVYNVDRIGCQYFESESWVKRIERIAQMWKQLNLS